VSKDGRAGVTCAVEINSASEPFYAPILIETVTSGRYEWTPGNAETIEGVYVAARCDGYDVAMVSDLTIRPVAGTMIRDVVVGRSKAPPSAGAVEQ
jgi:hypothetical protein